MTLTFEVRAWILNVTHCLIVMDIYGKSFKNPSMHTKGYGLDKKILTDGRTDTEQTWRLSWAYRKWACQWNGLQVWVRLCECRPWNTCVGGCFNIQSAYESYICCYLINFRENVLTLSHLILATVWYCISCYKLHVYNSCQIIYNYTRQLFSQSSISFNFMWLK